MKNGSFIYKTSLKIHNKESLNKVALQIINLLKFFVKHSIGKRVLSLTLIFALIMPFLFLGGVTSVSAQNRFPSNPLSSISIPSFSSDFGGVSSINFSPSLIISNAVSSVSTYVTAPTLPNGFDSATPVSPLYSDISFFTASAFSSVGSLFGFFVKTSSTEESEEEVSDGAFPNGAKPFDFDGDGKANVSSWNPSTGEWKTLDNAGNPLTTVTLGSSGDIPVPGDYDGDNTTDYAVFVTSTNTWTIEQSSNSTVINTAFGTSGDIPVAGDYDGDHSTDIAIFRPSNGTWHIQGSTSGYYTFTWGLNGDTPIAADFNNDNRTDYGIFRPSTGTWYVYYSDGSPYLAETWGNYGDQPVAADYDGDGITDLAVWRPKSGLWLIKLSDTGTYRYETLGINSDVPVPSAYVQKVGFQVPDYNMAQLRLEPKNAIGGTNLYSRNFGWGTGLVGLPGRAGLNAGFGISYNSLIWIKDEANDRIHFNPDYSDITPGFKMGFPTIESAYYDSATGKYSFLMQTPSGGRVEFKQSAATDTYNSIDSSFTQLKLKSSNGANDPPEEIGVTMTTTDGTQTEFEYKGGFYRVKQIKDRNGNYITVNHDEQGLLRTVTDTLGRVITVNYDAELYPTTITQDWRTNNGSGSAITHTYATFSYTTHTMGATFDTTNLTVYGQTSGSMKVLDKITFDDGSSTRFDYNGYGQVEKVSNYASDGTTKLNSVATNLDSVTGTQTDVPRLTQQRSYVKDFNNDNEVVVNNTLSASTTTGSAVPGESSESVKVIQIKMVNNPYDAATNIYVGDSGWKEGLPILTEDYVDVVGNTFTRKRWSFTKWEQDDETLSYAENPRTIRTKVGDDENSSVIRTEIDYLDTGALAGFNLPEEVKLYDNTTNALQKKSITSYEDATTYINKRIIGLPQNVKSYGYDQNMSQVVLVANVDYAYDEEDFTKETNQIINSVIKHDSTYGASFIVGRGNLTSITRKEIGTANSTTSKIRYDIAGSPVATINPLGHKIKTDYTDNFNDTTTSRNTFAYPTTLTDSDDNSSTVKYRFDLGANVWAKSTDLNANIAGKESTREYDDKGRLLKQILVNNGAYTRYEYPNNQTEAVTYSTVTAGQGEVESRSYRDGAGRTLRAKTELPSSADGWSGSKYEYDILGRVVKSYVPSEIYDDNSTWTTVGDDAVRGWLFTETEYDWRGRVTKEINTDGTDKLYSYNGCGCAGGMEITIKGEDITETDWEGNNPNHLGRRTQKVFQDIQGRTYKTQVMQWNGTTPYTTTVNEFNGRDQVTNTKIYAGDTSSTTFQEATSTYDGYGRLKTRHLPQMDSGTNSSYNYNDDDSISSVVDARGATASYTYNNRGLVTNLDFAPPTGSTTIPDAPSISYTYNNIGNRTSMTDGLGTVNYEYNSLSQLTSETREFTETLANAPEANNGFKIQYDYTLSGQLKSITAPYTEQFNYGYDKIGRLTSVAGTTSFDGIMTYASNPTYNARRTLTSVAYGNGTNRSVTGFNSKLQATGFEVTKGTTSIIKKQYQFYDDGSLKFVEDDIDDNFDKLYKYDAVGNTTESKAGIEARGGTSTDSLGLDRPYSLSYSYNTFGKITQFSGYYYNTAHTDIDNYVAATGRNPNWTYDANGQVTEDDDAVYEYNAAGQLVETKTKELDDPTQFYPPTIDKYDGNGKVVKRTLNDGSTTTPNIEKTNLYIRSSVLNKLISETTETGDKYKTFVFANGVTLAEQIVTTYNGNTTETIKFFHQDASGSSVEQTKSDGTVWDTNQRTAEYDVLGRNVANSGQFVTLNETPPETENDGTGNMFGSGSGYRPGKRPYEIDGVPVSETAFWTEALSASRGGLFGLIENSLRTHYRKVGEFTRTIEWYDVTVTKNGDITFETHTASRTWNVYEEVTWSVTNLLRGEAAPLTDEENEKLDIRVEKLINKKLSKDRCKEFLVDKLGEDGYKELLKTLRDKKLRFSASRSKDITVEDAGIFKYPNIRHLLKLSSKYGKNRKARQLAREQPKSLDWSVSKWAKKTRGLRAVLGTLSDGTRVIYYKSFNKITTILHENMHISTGLDDISLAEKLGLKAANGKSFSKLAEKDKNEAVRQASHEISQELIRKGCSN